MEKLTQEERQELKSQMKKLKKESKSLINDLENIMLSFEDRLEKKKEIKKVFGKIKRIKHRLINDQLFGGLSPEEIEKKKIELEHRKYSRTAKKLRKKTRHTWGTAAIRVFGSQNKERPHRRVNMGEGGSSKFIESSSSVHMIYIPSGGQNKKY